ncbi:hypothetical protein [Thioclava sp.]|uniref:hypothetical protein n=1 Tax=Thioclava sp. TaxID=1933450 RepID=UPI003AA7B5B8
MNRARKEELKKYREAREGLSPAEIEELDKREADEKEKEDLISLWHCRLFPEEYDFMLDDGVDAKRRAQGINPMSEAYIAKTNARRAELGFGKYMDSDDDQTQNTEAWVREMIEEGRIEKLETIYQARKASETEANTP